MYNFSARPMVLTISPHQRPPDKEVVLLAPLHKGHARHQGYFQDTDKNADGSEERR